MGLRVSVLTERALSKLRWPMTCSTPCIRGPCRDLVFLPLKFSQQTDPPLPKAGRAAAGWETPIKAPWRMPAQGELTGGCHISSAGSGLPSHTSGCTCSTRPRGSSLRPRAPGWVSCSRTPLHGTTETQQGGPRGPQCPRIKPAHSPGNLRFPPREKAPCRPKLPSVIHVRADRFGACMLLSSVDLPSSLSLTPVHLWHLQRALKSHVTCAPLEFSKFSEKGLVHMVYGET